MRADTINQRLRDILRQIREQAPHEDLAPDGNFVEALALDSLDIGNFVVELENEFSVRLEIDGLGELNTLTKLASFILKEAAERA